ncbi:DUF4097 family beta strand repeat-containing protein [Amycolatopsis sp. NPDC001319]|uniref:DUF4097 family beta strand repeat-containing protein n=1 Tax=unclassified Amycolatopsis TaxID=2618356 RepID=UPI0036768780
MSRTITHTEAGPVDLVLSADIATVVVQASEECTTASVHVDSAVADGAEAARLIEATTAESRGRTFAVTVPRSQGASGTTIVRNGGSVIMSAGTITGDVTGLVIGGDHHGVTIVNGQVVTGSGTFTTGGRLRIIATVPAGSTLTVKGTAPDVTTRGQLNQVKAETTSGDLTVGTADQVDLRTMSGDVRVGASGHVRAKTMSGDVTLDQLDGTAHVKTMSGDIRVAAVAKSTVTAESMSGDITLDAPRGIEIDAKTRTMSGRTSNRRS